MEDYFIKYIHIYILCHRNRFWEEIKVNSSEGDLDIQNIVKRVWSVFFITGPSGYFLATTVPAQWTGWTLGDEEESLVNVLLLYPHLRNGFWHIQKTPSPFLFFYLDTYIFSVISGDKKFGNKKSQFLCLPVPVCPSIPFPIPAADRDCSGAWSVSGSAVQRMTQNKNNNNNNNVMKRGGGSKRFIPNEIALHDWVSHLF